MLSTRGDGNRSRTYRNREQLVVCVAAVVVVGTLNVIAIADGGEGAALLTARIAFLIVFTIAGLRAGFSSLTATEEGIQVSNTFSSFSLSWGEIEHFQIGRWYLLPYVCLIRLRDGRTMHATGVQEARIGDGSAEDMVDDLNAELAKRTGGGSARPQVAVDSR